MYRTRNWQLGKKRRSTSFQKKRKREKAGKVGIFSDRTTCEPENLKCRNNPGNFHPLVYLYLLALAAVLQGRPGPAFTSSELIGFIFRDTPIDSADLVLLLAAPAVIY